MVVAECDTLLCANSGSRDHGRHTPGKMRVGSRGGWEMMPSVEKAAITSDLASRLVAAQFPQWAGLPVRRLSPEK